MAKRGDRVAPPAGPERWELRFAPTEAAKGWEDLCRSASANTFQAWVLLSEKPLDPDNPSRQHKLKGPFATREIAGRELDQWQYEVTAAGRVWYCPDPDYGWCGSSWPALPIPRQRGEGGAQLEPPAVTRR